MPWKPYGQIVELDVVDLGAHGEGLGTANGINYRVAGALPGEKVRARTMARRPGVRLGALEEVLQPSPQRVQARCPAFLECGGCSWQQLDYPHQVAALEARVRKLFEKAGAKVAESAWRPAVPAPDAWHYRNKIELTFGGAPGQITLGFNRRGRFGDVVDVAQCYIGPPMNGAVLSRVRDWASAHGLAPYNQKTHEGFLRFFVLRSVGEQWLGALVTISPPSDDWGLDALVTSLSELPGPGSLLHIVTDARANAVVVQQQTLLMGRGLLDARLGGLEFTLSFESFFQNNHAMAEELVRVVRERAGACRKVLDLYCGVGTLALALARQSEQVHGLEFVAAAVEDARANAARSGITNVTFETGAAEKYLWDYDLDLMVLDPPRSGLHPKMVRNLVEEALVPRILYVSCNPERLAEDLAVLQARYEVVFCQVLDLFPHTPHVETVVELQRTQRA